MRALVACASAVVCTALLIGCGSDDDASGSGSTLAPGETDAIDGAGSPAAWLFSDRPFIVRDIAAAGDAVALVGSLYDRDISFGGETHPGAGGSDGFVAIVDGSGQAAWSRGFGGGDSDEALAVAVRPSGNVVVGGFFRETIDLGAGPLTDLRTRPGFSDPYFGFDTGALLVLELDPEGALLWSHVVTSEAGDGAVSAVALRDNGEVVLAGTALGDLDFGDGLTSGDGIFVARLDADGTYLQSQRFEGDARVTSIAADEAGVVLAGSYQGTLDFGAGPLPQVDVDEDGFVVRLDSDGSPVWTRRFGGERDDRVWDVAIAPGGDVVVSGEFGSTLDLSDPVEREDDTGFAARLDATGAATWSRAFGGRGPSRATHVALGDDDTVFVGGGYRDGVDLGGGEMLADTDDGFVTGMSPSDGAHLFSRRVARFNFMGLARRGSELLVAGTCEGACGIGGAVLTPEPDGRLIVAALSTDPSTHLGPWPEAAELWVDGTTHAITSAIAVPGASPENPQGMTLVLSTSDIGCSARPQLPRNIATGGARRTEPELALLLPTRALGWHDVTSWYSEGGGGTGGSTLVVVERIGDGEIHAYVEHHEEATGSSNTAAFAMGRVTFTTCF